MKAIPLKTAEKVVGCFANITPILCWRGTKSRKAKLRVIPDHQDWGVEPGCAFKLDPIGMHIVLQDVSDDSPRIGRRSSPRKIPKWCVWTFVTRYPMSRDEPPYTDEVNIGNYGSFSMAVSHAIKAYWLDQHSGAAEDALYAEDELELFPEEIAQ